MKHQEIICQNSIKVNNTDILQVEQRVSNTILMKRV